MVHEYVKDLGLQQLRGLYASLSIVLAHSTTTGENKSVSQSKTPSVPHSDRPQNVCWIKTGDKYHQEHSAYPTASQGGRPSTTNFSTRIPDLSQITQPSQPIQSNTPRTSYLLQVSYSSMGNYYKLVSGQASPRPMTCAIHYAAHIT